MGRLVFLTFALGVAGCGPLVDDPLSDEELTRYSRCESDAECIVIENGCCCDMVSIQQTQRSEFRARFSCEEACECSLRPMRTFCREGSCRLVILAGDPP